MCGSLFEPVAFWVSHQATAAAAARCCSSWTSSTCSPTTRTRRCSTTCLTCRSPPRLPSPWSALPAGWCASLRRPGLSASHRWVLPCFNKATLLSPPPGCSGAAGEAGEVAVLPPSDPPAEQPDVPSVPGARPNPARPAGRLPRRRVRSGLERRHQGEAFGSLQLYRNYEACSNRQHFTSLVFFHLSSDSV